ncbi:MAG: Rrf2 family transcriptional regulator [Synechococcaceae cyanobacterium SM2_3_1]|nr:Rrf2 family transcriptional regulator [Synechococcaceae cyanobacterium SM2_3_1]
MKLTTRGYYSIKAMLDLAILGSKQPTSVRTIAQRQQIPAPYLEKLLIELRQSGLVRSQRGAQGGYQLTRNPRQISLAEILEAVGERLEARDWTPQPEGPAEDWVTRAVWQRISSRVQQVLQETTLEDLYFDARSWQAAQGAETGFMV